MGMQTQGAEQRLSKIKTAVGIKIDKDVTLEVIDGYVKKHMSEEDYKAFTFTKPATVTVQGHGIVAVAYFQRRAGSEGFATQARRVKANPEQPIWSFTEFAEALGLPMPNAAEIKALAKKAA